MGTENLDRKLAAIFYADVAEYSRLTGLDEEGTHKILSTYLDAISARITRDGGRVLHYAGDAVLAEFASVVVAVQCAIEVQRELAERNELLADDRKVQFRLGINLGDVIVDRDELYGDGVNVAARLEDLAEPGGICISGKVLDEVRKKLDVGYIFLGNKLVKNIERSIPVYRLDLEPDVAGQVIGEDAVQRGAPRRQVLLTFAGLLLVFTAIAVAWKPWTTVIEPASVEEMAFPLPDKPSIAILPFDNLSGDPSQQHVADGISENIIMALSQVSSLFVIARNSSFVYQGKAVNVKQVATELGVHFVLEGSIQRSGDRLRITAQLIDALSGNHLWAERYDRQITDLFALQDEITEHIVTALQIKLTAGEQMRVYRRHTRSLEAWNLLAKGVEHLYRRNKADNAQGRQLLLEATEVDPEYSLAWALIAWSHWFDAQFGWTEQPKQSFVRAAKLAEKARLLNDELPDVYALLGALKLFEGQHQAAIAFGEKAVALNPNHANNMALLAMFLHNAGRAEDSVHKMKRAMRLSPYYPEWFLEELGFIYLDAKQPEKALSAFARFLERAPSAVHAAHAHIGQALAYHNLGRDDEARKAVAAAVDTDSSVSLKTYGKNSLNIDFEAHRKGQSILRNLGLPE